MVDREHGWNAGTQHNVRERDPEQVWGNLDRLPPVIREILWSAPFDMDEVEMADLVRQGRDAGYPDHAIGQVLRRLIRKDAEDQAGDWGPGYPRIPFTPLVVRYRPRRHYLR